MLKITTSSTYNIRGTLSLLSLDMLSLLPNSCLNFVVKMAISNLNSKGERILLNVNFKNLMKLYISLNFNYNTPRLLLKS